MKRLLSITALAALAVAGNASQAQALTLTCNTPLGAGENRQIVITTSVGTGECESSGSGNLPNENTTITFDGITYNWLEKDESSNNGGYLDIELGGAFPLDFDFNVTGDYILGLKFGGSGTDLPDWFIVQLTNVVSGTINWNLLGGTATGLSHASLWGTTTVPPPPPTIPEPATLLLLGSGLGVAGAKLRRRTKA